MQSASTAPPTPSTSASSGYLRGRAERADDQQRLQAPPSSQRQDRRPEHEAARQDRRLRRQHGGNRNTGAEQEHQKEDAAGALGQGLDAGMQVDAIDRVVAQERHWGMPTESMGKGDPPKRPVSGAVVLRFDPTHRGQSPSTRRLYSAEEGRFKDALHCGRAAAQD
jgi:hypothetical protein